MIYLEIFLPAILTVFGNIIFYIFIKKSIDKSIEEHRITFGGIFREKIEIYQNLLEKSYNLKFIIDNYYQNGNQNDTKDIFSEIRGFIMYYLKNQPFLSKNMINKLEMIKTEFEFIFENSREYYSVTNVSGIEPSIKREIEEKFTEVSKRMDNNKVFHELQNLIIKEMRKDLKTDP